MILVDVGKAKHRKDFGTRKTCINAINKFGVNNYKLHAQILQTIIKQSKQRECFYTTVNNHFINHDIICPNRAIRNLKYLASFYQGTLVMRQSCQDRSTQSRVKI